MSDVAVSIENVGKRFRLFHERNQTLKSAALRRKISSYEEFWAIRNISFEVPKGSSFALVGNNGSGKSTLLKCLAKILYPEEGQIMASGRAASLLEVGSGFHPELSGRENIYLNGSILGMKHREIDTKFDEIVEFAEIGNFLDQPVKNYSSGMYVRLGFSVAIHVDPDILVVDELLAVGDAAFQAKSLNKFDELKHNGKTIILVSHDLDAVREMCDSAAWIDQGSLKKVGPVEDVTAEYLRNQLLPTEAATHELTSDELFTMGTPLSPARTHDINGGGITQEFQKGLLCRSAKFGTHFVTPPIQQLFTSVGGVDTHGWPTTDVEVHENGSVLQHFELSTLMITSSGLPRITTR